jgi:RNA polymerase sigma-70 factor (ECF subfamily)
MGISQSRDGNRPYLCQSRSRPVKAWQRLKAKGERLKNVQASFWLSNCCVFFKMFIQNHDLWCLWIESVNRHSQHWSQELYESKATGLILYGRALGLSHAEAEDVLQDTFLALMQQAQRPAQPENYCVRSFRNRALNYRRSLWRRVAREFESARWFEEGDGETPEEEAAMRCLVELPMEQREVIVLKIWQGRTFEEIGEVLDISPNTAAGRYRYGLQKLKVRLEKEDYERERDGTTGRAIAFLATPPAVPEN